MSTATLTSLAMLKVKIDQGQDYLDYLRPFVLHVLCEQKPDPVTDTVVHDYIRSDFGLEIPERAIQMVLKRISRKFPLTREHGVYHITGKLPDADISKDTVDANRHISSVVAGLRDFSADTARSIVSEEEAVEAICSFLSEFNIPCLRAYLRGTTIPNIEKHDNALIVLVSKYVLALQDKDPERFESFMVVVKGHMLANALLCPDLQSAPKTYNKTTFYFDTPLLVRLLNLEGEARRRAIKSLVELLGKLGAKVATFSHSRDELERVIRGASDHLDSSNGRGPIVLEARKSGTTKSDLLMLAGRIDEELSLAGIEVIRTPKYRKEFQIDESAFENVLEDDVSYHNPRAKQDDINSVRSIYALRSGNTPKSIEHAKAVLVTSNSGFAHAAFEYGKDYEESRQVSSVITDFSLANMAWLKAPVGAPDLPMAEVIAFSYAALQPSTKLLDKYLKEIDKLEEKGTITERDHQLLRSSDVAQRELMNLTLGEEDALQVETITETLNRVVDEIKKEESEKYQEEEKSHRQTKQDLTSERQKINSVKSKLYWDCHRAAKFWSWVLAVMVGSVLLIGAAVSFGTTSDSPVLGWILTVSFVLMTIAGVINLLFGFSVSRAREKVQGWLLKKLLLQQESRTGLELRKG